MSTLMPGARTPNPETQTRIFETSDKKPFWVGRIATLSGLEQHRVFDATSILRGETYTSLGFLPPEQIDALGREIDEDDDRSVHFTVLEKPQIANGNGKVNVIGTSRLIVKDTSDKPLPIEKHFPEVFAQNPAPVGSAEGSRLIANHGDKNTQYWAGLSLVRAMTHYSLANNIEADYGLAERSLLRLFDRSGIPTKVLGEPKEVKELGGVLYPIEIEVKKMVNGSISQALGSTVVGDFFKNSAENMGEGFYDSSFLR